MAAPFDFPIELVRDILEIAAVNGTAIQLVGVSKDVRRWISPFLYREIVLDEIYKPKSFVHAIEHSDLEKAFFEQSVLALRLSFQNHLVDIATLTNIVDSILAVCSGVSRLTLRWPQYQDNTEWQDMISLPNLRHLSIGCLNLPTLQPNKLASITHLDVVYPPGRVGARTLWLMAFNHILELPNLTHLCFQFYPIIAPLSDILYPNLNNMQFPETLQVFVIYISDSKYIDNTDLGWIRGTRDKRVVFACPSPSLKYPALRDCMVFPSRPADPCESLVIEQSDIWTMAEKVIEKRRKSTKTVVCLNQPFDHTNGYSTAVSLMSVQVMQRSMN